MTIKELEEYKVICEKGSLAKASKELFMSPQGLSRVLKNLETELDCTLVNRTVSGLELTESGLCLKKYAEIVLNEYEKLRDTIENISKNTEGSVELLMAYDVIRYISPEVIMGFQNNYPDVDFSFQEYPDRMVEKMLMEKKGNIAVSIGPFVDDCFDIKSIKKYQLGLLVYEGHPLTKKKTVTVEDLKNQALYLEDSSFKINELIQSRCWKKGFEPNIVFETKGFDLCYRMCRMKKGVTVTVDLIHEDMKTDGVIMIPFEEKDMVWEIGILTLKTEICEPAVEKFLLFIDKHIAEAKC